jgi:transforming growth factor-beta-induced protein
MSTIACLAFLLSCRYTPVVDTSITPIPLLSEVVGSDTSLTLLKAAFERASLPILSDVAGKQYTLFAPDNAAWRGWLLATNFQSMDAVPPNQLDRLLKNHLLEGRFEPGTFVTGYRVSLAQQRFFGDPVNLSLALRRDSMVYVNQVKLEPDGQSASNGYLHRVKQVLTLPTLGDHLRYNPDIAAFLNALRRADLDVNYLATLDNPGSITVLAPDNGAFAAYLVENGYSSLAQIPQRELNNLLRYHIFMRSNVRSNDFSNNFDMQMLQGERVRIARDEKGAVGFIDARGRVARLTTPDVQGVNGIIHIVDKILLTKE